jgi:hypothetical protein
MGEAAFDDLAGFAHGFLADARPQPIAVAIDRVAASSAPRRARRIAHAR